MEAGPRSTGLETEARSRRSSLRWRALALLLLLFVSVFAGFGFLLWSDPGPAILALRGRPHAAVRSDPIVFDGRVQESFQLTTTGGLEFQMLLVRPDRRGPMPLLLVALDRLGPLEAARELPASPTCGIALLSPEFPLAESTAPEGLFDLRRRSDRTAANLLAALEFLRDEPWLDPAQVHVVGRGRSAHAAFLAKRLENTIDSAWLSERPPRAPSFLTSPVQALTYRLAFGGGRSGNLPARSEQLTLAEIGERISLQSIPSLPGSSPLRLQPAAR